MDVSINCPFNVRMQELWVACYNRNILMFESEKNFVYWLQFLERTSDVGTFISILYRLVSLNYSRIFHNRQMDLHVELLFARLVMYLISCMVP